ncbi:MAG: SMODS domain-containing nucleotidyltransferase, partial [Actinomycetota bacterium]
MTTSFSTITTLAEQFKGALTRVELREKRNRVIAAHTEIRGVLESDHLLSSWGVQTTLIGSYARDTAIYPGKDVDVFTKLTELDTSVNPRTVFEAVRDVLAARYGDRAQPQARSIKVAFPTDGEEDFHVDVVPAVRKASRWAIPRRDTTRWEAPQVEKRWVETDPEKMTELSSDMNATLKVDGQGAYVPVVKLVRQTRWHHRGKEKPGGFYFELMAYWAFAGGVDGDSFAEIFAKTLRAVAVQLDGAEPLIDPTLGKEYRPPPKPQDRAAAAAIFSDLATNAERALTLDRCPAAAIWRTILG